MKVQAGSVCNFPTTRKRRGLSVNSDPSFVLIVQDTDDRHEKRYIPMSHMDTAHAVHTLLHHTASRLVHNKLQCLTHTGVI